MYQHVQTGAGRSRFPREARRPIYPLTISLVLHVLILLPAPGIMPLLELPARQSDLRAKLHRAPAVTPVEEPGFLPAKPIMTAPMRQPETRVHTPPARRPVTDTAPESPVEQARPAAESRQQIEPIRSGVDVAGLRQYHLALGKKARQFRRYPEEARAARHKGRVTMRLAVSEMGSPLGISLLGSSSFALLDQAALEMMLLAASHTDVPESLRGHAFTIDLAIDYNPEDAP